MFSGEGCVSEAGPGAMDVLVFFGGELIVEFDATLVPVRADGSWAIGMVPNGFVPTEDAVGTWEVTGTCSDAETGKVIVDYDVTTFEVTAPPTPPTEPPPPPPPTEEPAPPAAPVPAEPSFTG